MQYNPTNLFNYYTLYTLSVFSFAMRLQLILESSTACRLVNQRTGRGGWGGCSPPCREKNSIIRAKLMYHSGKDTVRWDTCCSERQLTTEGKRPLSYHSLLNFNQGLRAMTWAQLFESRLALNPGFFFLGSKAFCRVIFSAIFRASNHQLVDKKKWNWNAF